jgi:glyoxylase-like metal-dependent hydrolase (beta-lactamase superfamily II)
LAPGIPHGKLAVALLSPQPEILSDMAELLRFPVAVPPAPGEVIDIAPGIGWLRMPLPFALDHINLWLLDDGASWTVVDCGYASAATQALWQRIFAERLAGRPIGRILVTHYHPDHIGLAGWLAERFAAPLWITEEEWRHARMMTADGDGAAVLADAARRFARRAGLTDDDSALFAERHAGYKRGVSPLPAAFVRLADDMEVAIGGRSWRVIVGEGHAPELACLYCAELGVLIAGDQILPRISPNISVPPHQPDADPLALYLRSLARLRRELPPETLILPSHNLPFRGVHVRINELAAHHRERCAETIAACHRPLSAADLLPILFRRPLDRHQTAFALGEALAHLHYVAARGEIERVVAAGGDGVDRFLRKAA